MINIYGTIVQGESSASGQKMNWNGKGSIFHQMNYFKNYYPSFFEKIIDCQMATININLNKKLNIKSWEYTFDQVYWLPNSNTWYEKLSFTPIIFIYNYQQVNAWLYKAYKSPHKNNDFLVEVISPYIEDLKTKQICELKINEKYFK